MSTTMTVTEARAALPDILERVKAGEEITLTRHGEPVAVVVRPDTLRVRRAEAALARAARLHDELLEARNRPLLAEGTLDADYAEELIAEVRASRSRG
jgi:prevent-host-death family protein